MPKFPKAQEHLYMQCSCDDFLYRRDGLFEYDHFIRRLENSRRVMVARDCDFLIAPKMGDERDDEFCIWRDEFRVLHFHTMTIGKTNRIHEVTVTLAAGRGCDWICKHMISVARRIWRLKYQFSHVYVCWAHDEFVKERLGWAQHQKGGLVGAIWGRLNHDVWVGGWDVDETRRKSHLLGTR